MGTALRIQDDRRVPRQRLARQRLERGVAGAGNVHPGEVGRRAQIEDAQRRIAAHDQVRQVGCGDVIALGFDLCRQRDGIDRSQLGDSCGECESGGDDRQPAAHRRQADGVLGLALQAPHERAPDDRKAGERGGRDGRDHEPRGTPASSLSVTAPRAVLL